MTAPIPGGGGRPPDPLPRSCDSDECVAALATVVTGRNLITSKCGELSAAKGRRDTLVAIAAVLSIASGVAFAAANAAVASIFGIAISPILFSLAITFLAAAIFFWTLAATAALHVSSLEGDLNRLRSGFMTATDQVTAKCPASCWGDLSMPSC